MVMFMSQPYKCDISTITEEPNKAVVDLRFIQANISAGSEDASHPNLA